MPRIKTALPRKNDRMKKLLIVGIVLVSLVLVYTAVNITGKSHIVTRHESVVSEKIASPVRLLLLSDLHCCTFGENNERLKEAIDAASPDLILLGGDIIHRSGDWADTVAFIGRIAERYPCFYVTGNHEVSRGEAGEIKNALRQEGVVTIGGKCEPITVGETTFALSGIDEYRRKVFLPFEKRDEELDEEEYDAYALETLRKRLCEVQPDDAGLYSVVLIHRPEEYETVFSYGFDLMLSGHAHGGQVIIPGILNGLYAPSQGLFPKVAGGLFSFDSHVLNVGRGLSKKPWYAARVFNPPELVTIDLLPAD